MLGFIIGALFGVGVGITLVGVGELTGVRPIETVFRKKPKLHVVRGGKR